MRDDKNVDGPTEMSGLMFSYDSFVTYVPLKGEVPFRDYVTLPTEGLTFEIPPRASIDPEEEAKKAIDALQGKKVAILMPGRMFDASGTRHGRGGGWYDRFLAHLPNEWIRIGFCFEHQFSEILLRRESWDVSMDAVCVVVSGEIRIYYGNRV